LWILFVDSVRAIASHNSDREQILSLIQKKMPDISFPYEQKRIINCSHGSAHWSMEALRILYKTSLHARGFIDAEHNFPRQTRREKQQQNEDDDENRLTVDERIELYGNLECIGTVAYNQDPVAIALLEEKGSEFCSADDSHLTVVTIPPFHIGRLREYDGYEKLECEYDKTRVVEELWHLLQKTIPNAIDLLPNCAKHFVLKIEDEKQQLRSYNERKRRRRYETHHYHRHPNHNHSQKTTSHDRRRHDYSQHHHPQNRKQSYVLKKQEADHLIKNQMSTPFQCDTKQTTHNDPFDFQECDDDERHVKRRRMYTRMHTQKEQKEDE